MGARQYAYFSELPLKTEFMLNGTCYKKRSTKTAAMVEPGPRTSLAVQYGDWFYFGQRDLCVVAPYSRLADDYFN